MKAVKIKCPSCRNEVSAIQYEGAKMIQGFCGSCEKQITLKLKKGCGVAMLMEKESENEKAK